MKNCQNGWNFQKYFVSLHAEACDTRLHLSNSSVLDCVRFARALQRRIDNMCNFKISRLWETPDSKKLKIVLNFQDCLVVSNFIPTFAKVCNLFNRHKRCGGYIDCWISINKQKEKEGGIRYGNVYCVFGIRCTMYIVFVVLPNATWQEMVATT